MPRHLRWRIAFPYLFLLIATLSLFASLAIRHVRQQSTLQWRENLMDQAAAIGWQAQPLLSPEPDLAQLQNLAQTTAEILHLQITIFDLDGQVLGASSDTPSRSDVLALPGVQEAVRSGRGSGLKDGQVGAAEMVRDARNLPLAIVQVQAPSDRFQLNPTILVWLAALVLIGAGVGVFLLATVINNRTLKPIRKITTAAQQMQAGNFHDLAFPDSPPELAELSDALRKTAQQVGTQIEALTSERVKLAAVLDQMTDGVMIVDLIGRVQLLNPTAERLFRIDSADGIGRSIVEIVRYQSLIDLWRKAKEGVSESLMLEIGSDHLFLQVVAIPLKSALPGSTMILFQDLTQLRRLETVRRDFISNVSHELRTPLASLKALAETLQGGALDDPPAARRFVFRMETEIDNLTQMVNELLELSRIESGKVPIAFRRVLPCDLVRPAAERMLLQAERAGLDLIVDCRPELPEVFADPARITQVLINLIHNAIKFTPSGGKITLSAYEDRDHIVFYVRDTGVGIARKDLGRIFERFYKADRARTGGGTGLGLSIARHMIETHGGYIWAESEEKVGSTIYFSLPYAQQ